MTGPRVAWTVQRVPSIGGGTRVAAYAVAASLSVVAVGLLLGLFQLRPLALGAELLRHLGSRFGIEDLLLLASPLVMTGLSVAVMQRVGLWNIGADGQFFIGATGATAIALAWPSMPLPAVLPLMALAAAAGGALWIAIPATCRLLLGTSEIIATLLFNFIARLLVDFLVTGPWRDRHSSVTAQTRRLHAAIPHLPRAWHLGAVHWGIVAVPVIALLASLAFRTTRWGYELRFCGANREAAAYAGMDVRRRLLEAMLIGGALAGLGGMLELAGTVHRLEGGLSNGDGYVGIIVAVLAVGSPLGVVLSGLLMALVLDAGTVLQTEGIPQSAALALTGLILLVAAIGERLAHYRLVPVRTGAPDLGRA